MVHTLLVENKPLERTASAARACASLLHFSSKEAGKSGWGRMCQKLNNTSEARTLPGAAESSSHIPVRGGSNLHDSSPRRTGEAASTVVRTAVSVGTSGSCTGDVGEALWA